MGLHSWFWISIGYLARWLYIAHGWSVTLTVVVVELGGHNRAGAQDNQSPDLDLQVLQHDDHTPSTYIQQPLTLHIHSSIINDTIV